MMTRPTEFVAVSMTRFEADALAEFILNIIPSPAWREIVQGPQNHRDAVARAGRRMRDQGFGRTP